MRVYNYLLKLESKGKLNGSIILMHLGTDRKSEYPFMMLSKLIDNLDQKDYKFVTISQILKTNLTQ